MSYLIDAEKLEKLAEWFDKEDATDRFRDQVDNEVQFDLRNIATKLRLIHRLAIGLSETITTIDEDKV